LRRPTCSVRLERTFQEEFHWSLLHRLDVLWNLEKQRRLALPARRTTGCQLHIGGFTVPFRAAR